MPFAVPRPRKNNGDPQPESVKRVDKFVTAPRIDRSAEIFPDPGRTRDQPVYSRMGGRTVQSMKKGGKVKKTGVYRLHKGETVKPAPAKRASPRARKR